MDKIHTIRGVFFRKSGLTAPTFRKFEVGGDGVYYLKNGVFIEYHINLPHYACKYYNENIGTFEAALNPLGALEVVFSGTHYPEVEAAAKKILLHDSMGGNMRIADGEYTVSYVQNGVNQIIGVRANSEEEAKQKFLTYKARKGYDAEFVGVSYGFESKPGFPIIDEAIADTSGYLLAYSAEAKRYAIVSKESQPKSWAEWDSFVGGRGAHVFSRLFSTVERAREYAASNLKGFTETRVMDSASVGDAASGYINLSYKLGNDYAGVLVRANSLSEATAKLHEKYPSAKVLGNYTATPDEVQRLTSMGTPVLDSAVCDGSIVPDEGRSMDGIPYGKYVEGGRSYRGFEITSNENGLRKGFYRFYNWGGGIPFGNSATDGQFTESQFKTLIQQGKVRLLDEDIDLDETHAFGDDVVKSGSGWTNKGKEGTHGQFATKKEATAQTRAMYANGYKGDSSSTVYAPIVDSKVFEVRDKKSGKVYAVSAKDSVEAVAKVSKCLKDATPHEVVVYTNQVLSEMGLNNSLGKYDSVVSRMRGLYGQSFATGDDLKAIIKKALPSVLQYLGFPV